MKTKTSHCSDKLLKFYPCSEAVAWMQTQESEEEAWKNCKRGDWMLWLIGKVSGEVDSPERKKLVGCAAECVELALPIFEKKYPDDKRVRECIQACKDYADGKISRSELRVFRSAADAADAAAYAADAADAAAYAAYAADAAAYAAYAADAADAAERSIRGTVLSQCADIVRNHYPELPKIE